MLFMAECFALPHFSDLSACFTMGTYSDWFEIFHELGAQIIKKKLFDDEFMCGAV